MASSSCTSAETPQEANDRFMALYFAQKMEEKNEKDDKDEKKKKRQANKMEVGKLGIKEHGHKHVPLFAKYNEWLEILHGRAKPNDPSHSHWIRRHLELDQYGRILWKPTRQETLTIKDGKTKDVLHPMIITPAEFVGERLLAAHVDTFKGTHRGRDQTYDWYRNPTDGSKPSAGHTGDLYKPAMKSIFMDWIDNCPQCKNRPRPNVRRRNNNTAAATTPALGPAPPPAPASASISASTSASVSASAPAPAPVPLPVPAPAATVVVNEDDDNDDEDPNPQPRKKARKTPTTAPTTPAGPSSYALPDGSYNPATMMDDNSMFPLSMTSVSNDIVFPQQPGPSAPNDDFSYNANFAYPLEEQQTFFNDGNIVPPSAPEFTFTFGQEQPIGQQLQDAVNFNDEYSSQYVQQQQQQQQAIAHFDGGHPLQPAHSIEQPTLFSSNSSNNTFVWNELNWNLEGNSNLLLQDNFDFTSQAPDVPLQQLLQQQLQEQDQSADFEILFGDAMNFSDSVFDTELFKFDDNEPVPQYLSTHNDNSIPMY